MNIEESLWVQCGAKIIDHVAVTTRDIKKVLRDYLGLPGSELIRGPGYNSSQNVDYAFIRTCTGITIEILGVRDNSPINQHVESGGGAYHLCFAVDDLEKSIEVALNNGAIQVVEPRQDDAFDGRRVAFLLHHDHGLFEFLESFPKCFESNANSTINKKNKNKDHEGDESSEITKKVFFKLFPELTSTSEVETAEYDITPGWGSFKHLQLFMEVERLTKVSFTAEEIASIQSYQKLEEALKNKMAEL